MAVTGYRYQLAEAGPIAASIVEALTPYCQRIEIAGSIRRRAAEVSDVEILAIPDYRYQQPALFDLLPGDAIVGTASPTDCLDEYLADLLYLGDVRKRRDRSGRTFWGPSDKRLMWCYGAAPTDWIPVDLFCARPETWGAKLMIRTGPWQLSKRLVTQRAKGGLLPDHLEFRDGGLWRYDGARRSFVPTPDEQTLFRELGLPYVDPAHRTPTTYRSVAGQRGMA